MASSVRRIGAVACSLFGLIYSAQAAAATVAPGQEYSKYVDGHQTIQAMGPTPFGEQISLRDGSVQFRQVDIDLPGIGPSVQIARTLRIHDGGKAYETTGNNLGGWEMDIPRFKTMTSNASPVKAGSPIGWQVPGTTPNSRCSNFSAPGLVSSFYGTAHWQPWEWWSGYQLVDEQGGEQQVLRRGSIGTVPSNGVTYVGSTTQNWLVSCLSATANGQPGEAFLGLAPDGTKYWFNYLVYTTADSLQKSDTEFLDRRYGAMLVTRVEDRFGNYVNYQYSNGLLTQIDASDGRHIDIARTGTTVTIGANLGSSRRVWTYETTNGQLTRVVLPDGSAWLYSFASIHNAPQVDSIYTADVGSCTPFPGGDTPPTITASATAPSGVTESFTFRGTRFGRSYVPRQCWGGQSSDEGFAVFPIDWRGYAIVQRSLTGPGLGAQTWNYSYSAPNASWQQDCASGCASTVWTDVTGPDGTRQRSIFSNKYDETENLLLREETYATSSGALVKSIDFTYATFAAGSSNPYPWPTYLGDDLQSRTNQARSERWAPNRQTTITQDGVTFSSYVNNYDAYARPLSVGKWSSLGYSKSDVTEYYDDTTHWVLGQIKRHYNADTNLVDVRNEYDPNTALVLQTYAFEKLKATMTYNADGTLATSKDGNNNTTTFSNWKRGIPQAVQYADGTSISALVNDNGWITAVTDENGFSTGYGYDAMGRVAAITYPGESTFNYNATTITFAPSNTPVYGLPAGHWRQVTQTGNRKKVVIFDALWRPIVEENYDAGDINNTLSQVIKRYDSAGRVTFQSLPQRTLDANIYNTWGDPSSTPNATGVWTTFDALGRTLQLKQDSEFGVLTTTTEYLTGFQVRTTNPRGYQTTNGYQVYDQPSYEQLAWSAQPENRDVIITRNFFGMPLTIKQADHANAAVSVTRSYAYDGYMLLCKTLEPETGATVMDYDAAGNLAWTASGLRGGDYDNASECPNSRSASAGSGRRVGRDYDARNRITGLWFMDGVGSQSWTYTPDGLVASSIVDNDGPNLGSVDQVYTYNRRRLLAGESMSQRGWYTWSIGYGYDANANVAANTYPDGFNTNFANNALGQPTQVTSSWGTLASGVTYYPNGAISQFTYGNGIVHTMTQNARQLPARSTDAGVINYSFSYDANANPTVIADDQLGAHWSRWLTYDGLDRLTSAGSCSFGGDCYHRFSYNALDNITSWTLGNGAKDYANYIYDVNNRLTQINNTAGAAVVTLSYDAQGNLATKNGQAYQFDYGNRLKSTFGKESYHYDAQGRRVSQKSSVNGDILSMYGMNGQLMFQQDGRQHLNIPQVYLSGSVLARAEWDLVANTGQLKYEHTDALGSPVAITNQAGQVIERSNYEPYGNVIGRANNDRVGYTGHVMDSATGLTYMQQRYYDPTIGRFLSVDPIAVDKKLAVNFNRFAYANNNPYKFTDPDGRMAMDGNENGRIGRRPTDCPLTQCDEWGMSDQANKPAAPKEGALPGNGGNHSATPVSDIDASKWRLAGELTEGNTMAVDSKGGIIIQAKSNAWPATAQFGYNVSQRPLAFNGKLAATIGLRSWYADTFYSSGFTGGKASGGLMFTAYPGAGGNRWYVEYPSQASTHDNVFNSVLRIYIPYSH